MLVCFTGMFFFPAFEPEAEEYPSLYLEKRTPLGTALAAGNKMGKNTLEKGSSHLRIILSIDIIISSYGIIFNVKMISKDRLKPHSSA